MVQEAPEEVGRVRVGMSACGGLDPWVQANEEREEVGGDGVREEVVDASVFARGGVAAAGAAVAFAAVGVAEPAEPAAAGAGSWGRAGALFGGACGGGGGG